MADIKYYDVILKPVITEKSMNQMAEKKYTFLVHPQATKSQVKEAVEKMFEGAKVASVNTINCDCLLYTSERKIQSIYVVSYEEGDDQKARRVIKEILDAKGGFLCSDTEDFEPMFTADTIL